MIFLLAGGPGQASTEAIDIAHNRSWTQLFPGYTLVTFDPRGTGSSDPLTCDETYTSQRTYGPALKACAEQLGPARDYYGTTDNARDIDGVRRALGFNRIAVFAVSYGTDVALTYARLYPHHVERLLLDSVATPLGPPSVVAAVLRGIPRATGDFCRDTCGAVTPSFARDVVALANELGTTPLRGRVRQPGGATRFEQLNASRFVQLVLGSDLAPELAAELPAAVKAALGHEPQPLLRIAQLVLPAVHSARVEALYTATVCDDGGFPWSPSTPVADRQALLVQARTSLPAGSTGAFGPWADSFLLSGSAMCLDWPASTRPAVSIPVAYPDIPVLALSGAYDMRAPRSEAEQAIAHFPRGHLLVVANAGHSALTTAPSKCTAAAVQAWLAGHVVPRTCGSARKLPALGVFPAAVARPSDSPKAALAGIEATLRDAEATGLLVNDGSEGDAAAGIAGGELTLGSGRIELADYRDAPGLSLSGELTANFPLYGAVQFAGVVRVTDGRFALGTLTVNGGDLDGTFAGRPVVASRVSRAPRPPALRLAPHWSAWSPPPGSTAEVARAIAQDVGAGYLLRPGGPKLVNVSAGPPVSPKGAPRPVVAIAVPASHSFDAVKRWRTTAGTWAYSLCGTGPYCSIGHGKPTAGRGRLVSREGLELALYTFRYDPGVTTVLVYLPPPAGLNGLGRNLLLFDRHSFAAELRRPLEATLPLVTPPLPDAADTSESATIYRLTIPHLYGYLVDTPGNQVVLQLLPFD